VKITKEGNDIAEFAYDALGRRIRKTDLVADTNTLYYYNVNWQVLSEYDGAGSHKQSFAYGNYIDEPVQRWVGHPDSQRYYIHDHLYSTVAYTDRYGVVLERYEYDAYGNPHILDANFAYDDDGLSDDDNPYMFTGRRADFLDGCNLVIQYNRNRYYDYYTGRWLTQDPAGYVDGMNLYLYAEDNPITSFDPSGLSAIVTNLKQTLKTIAERQLPVTKVIRTLWKSGRREIYLIITAFPVKNCPKVCPCADVSVQVAYTTSAKKETQVNVPWGNWGLVNPRITWTGGRGWGRLRLPRFGGGGVRQRLLRLAQGRLRRAMEILPAITVKDLLTEKGSWSLSGGINHARVCMITCKNKLIADICKIEGSVSGQIGSTRRSPREIAIDVGVTASVDVNWNACKGALKGTTKGEAEVTINIPGPWNVATSVLKLWDFTFLNIASAPKIWEKKVSASLCGGP